MGVFEESAPRSHVMHWQQHEQYIGPAYDPSRDLSPNLPSCDSSMGDDPSISSGSSCSTPSNNNHQSCGSEVCRPPPTSAGGHQHPPRSVTPAELCRPHSSFEHHIPKLEPIQPPGTPPTPTPSYADENVGGAVCAGCRLRISDRFYLQAVDRRWHSSCLQCCQCRNALDGEITCFSRDGNIYCKKDYYRLFGMKRCAKCHTTILSSELVMRARELVFHVHCFSCAVCNQPLTKGDHFGMREGAVLCRLHFEMPSAELPLASPGAMYPGGGMPPHHYPAQFPSPDFHHAPLPPQPGVDGGPPMAKVPFFNGAPTTPRQKGRPRKRKPKDLEGMTASLDLNSDYLDMSFGRSPGTPGMHGSSQRTKRMRTSFKHHQLRTMKSYFAINHNPDAKDLKQLSQKTGLPKRVLQVWFQNARAKWRRMMLKQEGKSGDKCSGSDNMSDMDLYPHGPSSMGSSIQSMAPHSPPFILPPGSPSSLDCS
ncbi:LIM/homeobox protein Lhx9-like isoform X1 [Coccinella septempunctata]|uniref:LIM/homeobox protein Lhx9-like isoform X1 n=1 Tax=Coccinella septempunctata TaxID=41139 RepID=UPI001D061E72|nr:LIM/homeobox protein Lhx9-like isoform X1 [Coccinella septempunctata]